MFECITYIRTLRSVYIDIYLYLYVYIYICMCVSIAISTDQMSFLNACVLLAHLCLTMLRAPNEEAYDLYSSTVGRRSPLFCGAAEGKAKALQKECGVTGKL